MTLVALFHRKTRMGKPIKNIAVGYHASVYCRLGLGPSLQSLRSVIGYLIRPKLADRMRRSWHFEAQLETPLVVDQLGAGTTTLRGGHAPSFLYMATSQRFLMFALEAGALQNGITSISLPTPEGWLRGIAFDDQVYSSLTIDTPSYVGREIRPFAFKNHLSGLIVEQEGPNKY